MITLNALLRYSADDKCYVAETSEIVCVGDGKTKKSAIDDLITSIRATIDHARSEENISLFHDDYNEEIHPKLDILIKKYPNAKPKIIDLEGYCTLHIYDSKKIKKK